MRFTLALVIFAICCVSVGCAQQKAPPPETISDWMEMEQVHP
jgi:hypothetical protein